MCCYYKLKTASFSSSSSLQRLSLSSSMAAAANRLLKVRSFSTSIYYSSSSLYARKFSSFSSQTDLPFSNTLRRDPKDRNVQWVFLGCPGVGKGTYASRLSHLLGVPHIATGDLVREELSSSGPLSQQVLHAICSTKFL